VFEQLGQLTRDADSVLEAELRALLNGVSFQLAPGSTPHQAVAAPTEEVPGADRLQRLLERGGSHLQRAATAHREAARAAAEQAEALAAFARCRPSSLDRPDTEIGAAAARTRAARPAGLSEVSEWAVDEAAVALHLTSTAASAMLVDSVLLTERLPATLAALRGGRISWRHAQVMTDLVARLSDELRPIAEARLLERAGGKTASQLRVAARRLIMKLDADALAQRVTEAIRGRRVVLYPGDDGMATLSAVLPVPVARAVLDALRQYAEVAATEGDERTLGQRMVDCLVDLVLRPGEHGMPPVQARLTLVAAVETLLGSDEPGEVDGHLVPAEMVRQLAVALGLQPGPKAVTEPADAAGTEVDGRRQGDPKEGRDREEGLDREGESRSGGTTAAAIRTAFGGSDGHAGAVAAVSALLRTRSLRGTALEHRPHVALVDELTGQLVALSDAFGLRRGQSLGPPPDSPGYSPEAELDRFVRHRDRRCRFPGCRARPIRCDLDHTVPWPWGPTSAGNLCCLCRHHHRLSHQAPGWRLRGLDDGGLEWTTPGGIVARTDPPRFGADDDLIRGRAAAAGVTSEPAAPVGAANPPESDVPPDESPF
jgi:hypothetical protein